MLKRLVTVGLPLAALATVVACATSVTNNPPANELKCGDGTRQFNGECRPSCSATAPCVAGTCVADTCSRLDYSQGVPPRSVLRDCMRCQAGAPPPPPPPIVEPAPAAPAPAAPPVSAERADEINALITKALESGAVDGGRLAHH